jgi:hypothetical protein
MEDSVAAFETRSIRVVKICIPVFGSLIVDTFLVRCMEQRRGIVIPGDSSLGSYMTYGNDKHSTVKAIVIPFLVLFFIISQTYFFMFLYDFRCQRGVFVCLATTVSSILTFFLCSTLRAIPIALNIPLDYISLFVIVLNVNVIANVSILWRGPKIVTQLSLLVVAVFCSLFFLPASDLTIWVLLGLLVIYDVIAVLCPNGLLNVLIQEAQRRGESIPALVYSSAAMALSDDDGLGFESEEDGGDTDLTLGLADFWFYGILTTRAARIGWDVATFCILAIVLGLAITLFALDACGRPLPALPVPIVLGVAAFATAGAVYRPFVRHLMQIGVAF